MSEPDAITDVVELCTLLQCLGFTVKSLDTSDVNASQDGGARTVVVNCQSSGLHVVLESASLSCSCPVADQQNSGFWQVSGITGGKQHDKESGHTLLKSIPKFHRDRLSKELRDMVRSIKSLNDSDVARPGQAINKSASMLELANKNKSGSLADLAKEGINKSASMVELGTPEKRHLQLKAETPTRYRSLDTLTSAKEDVDTYRMLQKQLVVSDVDDDPTGKKDKLQTMCGRQSTYTIYSTPGSVRRRNKTSSPIQAPQNNLLDNLIEAEKAAESLRNKLALVIREFVEDGKNDSSMSSMLDVSKISVLKGAEASKAQFASSPNLSGLGVPREDFSKSKLKRYESVSTSNLGPKQTEDGKSRLKRISPTLFKLKKDTTTKVNKVQDGKSKLQNLFRPKLVTPIRTYKPNAEASPNLSSASKKKFSHVKSTIPRPTPKKE